MDGRASEGSGAGGTLVGSRIRGFDGMRAIAFLLVFVSHKVPLLLTDRYGSAGVWIFFVLSGFLITRILVAARERVEASTSTARNELVRFYLRRTGRIFPAYYLFLTVMTLLALAGWADIGTGWRQVSYWTFLTNLYVERNGWYGHMGHLWSLAVEEQFYLLFAPLVLLLPIRAEAICWVLVVIAVIVNSALLAAGAPLVRFDVDSAMNFGLLAMGGLAGLYADRALPRSLAGDGAAVATLVLVLSGPMLVARHEQWLQFGRLVAPVAGLLFVQLYQRQSGVLVRALEWQPLRWLGLLSYALYLIHPVIDTAPALAGLGLQGKPAKVAILACDLSVVVALAALSWYIVEQPVRVFVKSMTARVNDEPPRYRAQVRPSV